MCTSTKYIYNLINDMFKRIGHMCILKDMSKYAYMVKCYHAMYVHTDKYLKIYGHICPNDLNISSN